MEKPLSVLLIEDDPEECKAIVRYIDSVKNVNLVNVTNNTEKAIAYTEDYLPDAIILDLELHRGNGNGISFLVALKSLTLPVFPYILVTTNNISSITHQQARSLGADFVMLKSQNDYSAKSVIEFLQVLKCTIHASQKKRGDFQEKNETPAERRRRLDVRVAAEIELVGISPKVLGRKYLIEYIVLLSEGRTEGIVKTISEKHMKNPPAVERAMQNAISNAWSSCDIEILQRYYTAPIRSDKGVPTLTEFVHYFANKIKMS
ncbi:MAG: response regulator [Oscillospiraceae bacterium]|nr:response regulator [Oscillospiraceae bacterium]